MKKFGLGLSLLIGCLMISSFAFASSEGSILDSLSTKGVAVQMMDDSAMHEVRGKWIIASDPIMDFPWSAYNSSMYLTPPSVRTGSKTFMMKYTNFGSRTDYRSYRHWGPSHQSGYYEQIYLRTPDDPNMAYKLPVTGDIWLADENGAMPNQWSLADAQTKEYHFLFVDSVNPLQVYNDGVRMVGWNRPVGTFSW